MALRPYVKPVSARENGDVSMEEKRAENATVIRRHPKDFAKLISKLRWIGMEEEALRLQLVVRCLPPEQSGTVWAGPFSTD